MGLSCTTFDFSATSIPVAHSRALGHTSRPRLITHVCTSSLIHVPLSTHTLYLSSLCSPQAQSFLQNLGNCDINPSQTYPAGQGRRPPAKRVSISILGVTTLNGNRRPTQQARASGAQQLVPTSLVPVIKAASSGPSCARSDTTKLSLYSLGPLATLQPTQAGSMRLGTYLGRARDLGFNLLHPLVTQPPVEVGTASGTRRYSTDVAHH